MGSQPKSHRTAVLCSHLPRRPEGGLQQRMPGPPSWAGRGKGRWTHLGGECWLPPRPLLVALRQRRAPRRCSPASLVFRARSPGLQSIRGRCAQGRTLHPSKVIQSNVAGAEGRFCPGVGSGWQLAVGSPSLGGSCVPCHRRSCLRGIFFFPAHSWQRLGFPKTVNYAAFVCRVGGWG